MNRGHYCCAEERLLWAGNTKSLNNIRNLHFSHPTNFFSKIPTIGEVIFLNTLQSGAILQV